MGRSRRGQQEITQYVDTARDLMSKSESATSHVLLSVLFTLHRIKPYSLLPQVGGKKGVIDFVYMPPNDKAFNVFIELKRYGRLKDKHSITKSKYLKGGFPKPLKSFDRGDGWRLLILTDLNRIIVLVRKTEKKNKKRSYHKVISNGESPSEAIKQVNLWLCLERGVACREILWGVPENRYDIVRRSLNRKRKVDIGNRPYKLWTEKLDAGGRGWRKKFERALRSACGENVIGVPPTHVECLREVFWDKDILARVRAVFKDHGVRFKRSYRGYIFD